MLKVRIVRRTKGERNISKGNGGRRKHANLLKLNNNVRSGVQAQNSNKNQAQPRPSRRFMMHEQHRRGQGEKTKRRSD